MNESRPQTIIHLFRQTDVKDSQNQPEVGSSQKRMAGLVSASEANANRFFSPPEMPRSAPPLPGIPMSVFSHLPRPSSRITWFHPLLYFSLLVAEFEAYVICEFTSFRVTSYLVHFGHSSAVREALVKTEQCLELQMLTHLQRTNEEIVLLNVRGNRSHHS